MSFYHETISALSDSRFCRKLRSTWSCANTPYVVRIESRLFPDAQNPLLRRVSLSLSHLQYQAFAIRIRCSTALSHPKFPERFIQKVKYKDKWIVKKLSSLFRSTPQVGYLDSQSWFRDIWLFKHLTSWLLFLRIYHYSFPPLVSDCFLDRYITSHRTTPPRHQISNFDHLTVSLTILQDRKLIFPKKSPQHIRSLLKGYRVS